MESEFRYYLGEEFTDANCGRDYQVLVDAGYEGFPGFYPPTKPVAFRVEAVDAFRRRLPPEKRTDFSQYLEHYGLDGSIEISDMALLGITGARLPSDGFELVDPLTSTEDCFEVVLQIAGYRHYLTQAEGMQVGMRIDLELEPDNIHDPGAIAFRYGGSTVGHVNRLQTDGLKKLLSEKTVETYVMRLNGTQAHPRAYAYLKIRPISQQVAAE